MILTLKKLFSPQTSNNQRPSILHVEGLALLIAILLGFNFLIRPLAGPIANFPAILGFSTSITTTQVVEQTNQQRVSFGLGKLTTNSKLTSAAIAKGNDMCANQYWAHVSPAGVTPWVFMRNAGYSYAVAGENLARDFSDTPSMITAWMNSPSHRENMLNPRFNEIGVAVVDCMFLGSDTTLVIQMFGTPYTATVTNTTAHIIPAALATTKPSTASVESTSSSQQVSGAQSIPKQLVNVNPTLQLTPQTTTGSRAFSALEIMKAVSISIVTILILVLLADMWFTQQHQTVRLVGRNLAHILFLLGILALIIIIKSGVVL